MVWILVRDLLLFATLWLAIRMAPSIQAAVEPAPDASWRKATATTRAPMP